MDFILATNNAAKTKEVKSIFAGGGHTVRSLKDIGFDYEAVEDGSTFAENAIKKAVGCAEALRQNGFTFDAVLADDSGLCIDALDGQPGVYSARYMGEDTPYTVKNLRIIEMLAEVPEENRGAHFACVIACAWADGRAVTTEGAVYGIIAREPQGENGFGYDPVFFLPEYQKTMAQIPSDEKNKISHRGKAIRAMYEHFSD